jgi:hypothetical protein
LGAVVSVTTDNIAVALGVAVPVSGSPVEQQWEMWIDDAEMLIEARRVQLEVETIDQAKLDYVVRESVVAQVKRPDDSTQVTVSVDDGSTSKSYRSGKGRVTIPDELWALLGLTEPSGAFAIDMLGTCSTHLAWCSLVLGATYCSCGVDIAGFPLFESGEE